MLIFFINYATYKSINAFKDSSYNNSKEIDMYNNYKDLQRYQTRAYDYAKELGTAFTKHTAQIKREIAKSKITKVKQAKARKASCNFNLQRFTASLGSQGLNALSCVIVNANLERSSFSKDRSATSYKKRQYYYSYKVPSDYKVVALQLNVSKSSSLTKRCCSSSNVLIDS